MLLTVENMLRMIAIHKKMHHLVYIQDDNVGETLRILEEFLKSAGKRNGVVDAGARETTKTALSSIISTYHTGEYGIFLVARDKWIPSLDKLATAIKSYVLMPFPEANCENFTKMVKGDTYHDLEPSQQFSHGYIQGLNLRAWNVDKLLYSDTPGLSATLGELGANDMLYILGHCSPGSTNLEASDRIEDLYGLNVDSEYGDHIGNLAKLLSGLRKNFAGKIKIYGCNSSAGCGAEKSFAQAFANKMWADGYKSCAFYGYNRELKQGKPEGANRSLNARQRIMMSRSGQAAVSPH